MGDSDDGSSTAAQGARRNDIAEGEQAGGLSFLGRLFGALGAGERTGEPEEVGETPRPEAPPGILNLGRMRVDDVAIPKAEIVAVPQSIGLDELVGVFRKSGMTRLPVYTDTLDTPVGMIHLKDLALQHGFNGTEAPFNLRKMLRPLIYAPPSMPIGVLLQKMQADRTHMALVIDEYGGVDGLVTLEDLVEQVIGEIEDEHDIEEDGFWTREGKGAWLVQARAPLDEFEAEIGRRLVEPEDEEDIDTLGGLVVMLAGRVPARGEVIHHPGGPDFEVIDANPRRIKRLRVRLVGAHGG